MNERLMKLDFVSDTDTLGRPWEHSFNFNPALILPENSSIALQSIRMWNNLKNISANRGNNQIRYYNASVFKIITIPDGTYSIEALNTTVQGLVTTQGDVGQNIVITGNYSTLKCDITLLNGYQIDFTTYSIRLLLGFDAILLTASGSGSNPVDITNSITGFNVNVNVIDTSASLFNGQSNTSIYDFSPDVAPGSLINKSPNTLIYIPLSSSAIYRFTITLTDQNGKLLTDLGLTEAISTSFIIKSYL